MELRHLRYFVAVAEHLSFRRAAEQLHLTRPALSKQVKELENELDLRLLDRSTARVTLTSAGAVYLQEARDILARTEQAAVRARQAAEGRRGTLAVADASVLGLAFLAPVLTRFRERYPHVEVVLKEIPANAHVAAIERGEVEVGFAVERQVLDRQTIDSTALLHLAVGAALPRNHPLARRAQLEPAELASESFLYVGDSPESEHAWGIRRLFSAAGVQPRRLRPVAGLRSLFTMIASGHGISMLPVSTNALPLDGVVIVPLVGDPQHVEFELRAVWRRGETSRLVPNFIRTLRRYAGATPAPA